MDTNKVILGGTPVDPMDPEPALELNLHHFGTGGRWAGTPHTDPTRPVDWLYLLDGAPLVSQHRRLTGHRWPWVASSDLAPP